MGVMKNIEFVTSQADTATFNWRFKTCGGVGFDKARMLEQLNRMEPRYREQVTFLVYNTRGSVTASK